MTTPLGDLAQAMTGTWQGDEILTRPNGEIVETQATITVCPILGGRGFASDYEQTEGTISHTVVVPGEEGIVLHWYPDGGAMQAFEGTVAADVLTVNRVEDGMTHRLIQDVAGAMLAVRYELDIGGGKTMTLFSATYERQEPASAA